MTRSKQWIGTAFAILLALACTDRNALAGIKIGPEFQINTTNINNTAGNSDVAELSNGGFVAVWEGDGVFAQVYDAAGNRVGSELNVASNILASDPHVAGLRGGGFVVVWAVGSFRGERETFNVYGRLYNSAGTSLGSEFLVNLPSQRDQLWPAVAALRNGDFVVTWYLEKIDADIIWMRIYNAAGQTIRPPTKVANEGVDPKVAALSGAGFVVTWSCPIDGLNGECGQRFTLGGHTVGTQFTNSQPHDSCSTAFGSCPPSLVGLTSGGFVLVWTSQDEDVYGQLFDASAASVGAAFRVNTLTTGPQVLAAVSDLRGGFVVTWEVQNSDKSTDVHAQRYDNSGARLGGEFQVNTTSDASYPSTAGLGVGGFVVTWTGGPGILGQRFK